MATPIRSMFRSPLSAVLLAAFAGAAPALAQEARLSVQATPQVLAAGQSASVNVLAHFPSPPAVYAFASAEFDVHATRPAWTFASAGSILGADVLGISAAQQHIPQTGVLADPSNPYRVWRGVLSPISSAPALIEVAADIDEFWVYPSRLTSSAAPRKAEGGSDFVFVNPLPVHGWLAAPGRGTRIQVQDDVYIDGSVITGENPSPIIVGMLLPAVQKVRDAAVGVVFEPRPDSFSAKVQVQNANRSMVRTLAVTFDGQTTDGPHGPQEPGRYTVGIEPFTPAATIFQGFSGGVSVASGDIVGAGPIPALTVESLPDVIETRIGPRVAVYSGADTDFALTRTLCYKKPVAATVLDPQGQPRRVMLDRIELVGSLAEAFGPSRSTHNLRQLALGAHVFEAAGADRMIIEPRQPRPGTTDGRMQDSERRR